MDMKSAETIDFYLALDYMKEEYAKSYGEEKDYLHDAIVFMLRYKKLIEERDEERRRLLSWFGKFCRHIDNGDKWLTDEENLAFFREKMKQQFGWNCD